MNIEEMNHSMEELEMRAYEIAAKSGPKKEVLYKIMQDTNRLAAAIGVYLNELEKQDKQGLINEIVLQSCLDDVGEMRAQMVVNEGIMYCLLGDNIEAEDEAVAFLIKCTGAENDREN